MNAKSKSSTPVVQCVFDPCNWNSIRTMIRNVNKMGQMLFGRTTDDETIIFDVYSEDDENGNGTHDALRTSVLQDNGWVRINEYDPETYTVCERYSRDA